MDYCFGVQVEVTTTDGLVHRGWVYTLDPVSQSCVLLRFDDQQVNGLEVILGHFICSLNVVDDNVELHRSRMEALLKPLDDVS